MTDSLPVSAVDRGLASVAALQQAHATPVDSVLIAAIGACILYWLVARRVAIRDWFSTRAPMVRWALAVSAPVLIIADGVAERSKQISAHAALPPTKADSFSHARHTKVACLECHRTGEGHGRLTFERPRGCAVCHHRDATPAKCASCHRREQYGAAGQVTVTVTVPGRPPKPRSIAFIHDQHATRSCVECHTTPITLAPARAKATCVDCHTDHHGPKRNCSACHTLADPTLGHRPIEASHQLCDACHTPRIIAELTPTRSLCSTCHQTKAIGHFDGKECSVCHFLATPDTYRSRLTTPRGR